jgi:hypothetical protein
VIYFVIDFCCADTSSKKGKIPQFKEYALEKLCEKANKTLSIKKPRKSWI